MWDSVTNPVALRNMREMKAGDRVVVPHGRRKARYRRGGDARSLSDEETPGTAGRRT